MWDDADNYDAAGRHKRYIVYDSGIYILRICPGASAWNSSGSYRQRGNPSKCPISIKFWMLL